MTVTLAEERTRKTFGSVSLVVLNYNGKTRLKWCIDSLLTTNYPNFQVIIVDNGSTDGSVEFLEKQYPNIRMMRLNGNYGFAQGYNRSINGIQSKYIALVNNDVVVEPHWLEALVSIMEKNKDVAAATPKMLFLDGKLINAAGGSCDIYGIGWNRGNGEADAGQYDHVEETFYGNGGALLIRRQIWQEVGPFDERYFMYGEDLDWCWRARLKGYKIVYVPNAKVYHKWHGSNASSMTYMLEKHWLSTVLKNFSLSTLVSVLPRYFIFKTLKTVWLLRNGRPDEKTAVLRAILWNITKFRDTWCKRITIQLSRKVDDTEIERYMLKRSFELSLWLKQLRHPFLNAYFSSPVKRRRCSKNA